MEEQQSQKRGVRSDAQKVECASEGYETIPPAQPVAGAFGEHKDEKGTDHDVALRIGEKQAGNPGEREE